MSPQAPPIEQTRQAPITRNQCLPRVEGIFTEHRITSGIRRGSVECDDRAYHDADDESDV